MTPQEITLVINVSFLGKNSGFKTARDAILFCLGAGILLYHVFTVKPADYNIEIFILSCTLVGIPFAANRDEKK